MTKSHLTTNQIGDFEILLFIASIVSYFWMTGLIQSFLPLYNNNATFPGEKIDQEHKSPEIFNAFLLIAFFSLCIFILGHIFRDSIYVYSDVKPLPHTNLLLLYILLSNPAHFVEYIYLLRNKSQAIVRYGYITYGIQLVIVGGPVLIGYGIYEAILGLVIISAIRLLWLFFLIIKYAEFKISMSFIASHIKLGSPLIVSTLFSGSAQYVDGLVVANRFDSQAFALFRYGAKEFPIVVMLAAGLHNALLPEFRNKKKIVQSLKDLKKKSARLMHILFPVSTLMLFFSDFLYPRLFNEDFMRSSDIFMVYLLLVLSRLLFPQTILIGLKKTRIIMIASITELILNIALSVWLSQYYGLVGVALATIFIFFIEKLILILYNYIGLGIKPGKYIPVTTYLVYSIIIISVFVLIDHQLISVF
jgi:O-antigen/teichoic acid export membrane protein